MSHVKAGKLAMLATLQATRNPQFPDVPTTAELGIPTDNMPTWNAIFAPSGTPRDVIDKIATASAKVLKTPAVKNSLEQQGAEALGTTPQQLALAVEDATATWKAFVRKHNIPQE